LEEINADKYDVIILNYANPDMVGHTGVMEAAVKAVTAIDECLGRVVDAVLAKGGRVLVTADHGNAEQMVDPDDGQPYTAHTTNPVPFMYIDKANQTASMEAGRLEDIAPTMLSLLGIDQPAEMTGRNLIR
ncbi:MAG: alkaline phosphatase family protein, partial [Bacillota bacterium]